MKNDEFDLQQKDGWELIDAHPVACFAFLIALAALAFYFVDYVCR